MQDVLHRLSHAFLSICRTLLIHVFLTVIVVVPFTFQFPLIDPSHFLLCLIFLHSLPLFNQVWLTLFPEGTRFDPSKTSVMTKSMTFAKEHGLPELHHVLTPRTTGFEVG